MLLLISLAIEDLDTMNLTNPSSPNLSCTKLLKNNTNLLLTSTEIDLLNKELLMNSNSMTRSKRKKTSWKKPILPPEEILLISENGKPSNGKLPENLPDLDLLKILPYLIKHSNLLEINSLPSQKNLIFIHLLKKSLI